MKKTVLTFGVISGVIASILMLGTLPFMDRIGFDKGLFVGYTGMVLSFLLVFFGIRSYRDNFNHGTISFGRAFSVGALIMLISCAFYVITWEIICFKLVPDFVDKCLNHTMQQIRASGASAGEIAAEQEKLRIFAEKYRNPVYNAAITFILEPLPVGIVMTLISALILRKKKAREVAEVAPLTSSV